MRQSRDGCGFGSGIAARRHCVRAHCGAPSPKREILPPSTNALASSSLAATAAMRRSATTLGVFSPLTYALWKSAHVCLRQAPALCKGPSPKVSVYAAHARSASGEPASSSTRAPCSACQALVLGRKVGISGMNVSPNSCKDREGETGGHLYFAVLLSMDGTYKAPKVVGSSILPAVFGPRAWIGTNPPPG